MIATIMITIMDTKIGTITITITTATTIVTITIDLTTAIANSRAIGTSITTTLSGNARDAIGTANGNRIFTKDSFLRPKCVEAFDLSRMIYSFAWALRLLDTATWSSAITFV